MPNKPQSPREPHKPRYMKGNQCGHDKSHQIMLTSCPLFAVLHSTSDKAISRGHIKAVAAAFWGIHRQRPHAQEGTVHHHQHHTHRLSIQRPHIRSLTNQQKDQGKANGESERSVTATGAMFCECNQRHKSCQRGTHCQRCWVPGFAGTCPGMAGLSAPPAATISCCCCCCACCSRPEPAGDAYTTAPWGDIAKAWPPGWYIITSPGLVGSMGMQARA